MTYSVLVRTKLQVLVFYCFCQWVPNKRWQICLHTGPFKQCFASSSAASRTLTSTIAIITLANSQYYGCPWGANALPAGVAGLQVLILITGAHKAFALYKAIEEGVNHMWTVSAFQQHPRTIFVCDEDATLELRVKTVKYFKGTAGRPRTGRRHDASVLSCLSSTSTRMRYLLTCTPCSCRFDARPQQAGGPSAQHQGPVTQHWTTTGAGLVLMGSAGLSFMHLHASWKRL